MSQEKVDRYKEEKANRAKIQKKEKRTLFLEKCAIAAVCVAAISWIGYSAYNLITRQILIKHRKRLLQRWMLML